MSCRVSQSKSIVCPKFQDMVEKNFRTDIHNGKSWHLWTILKFLALSLNQWLNLFLFYSFHNEFLSLDTKVYIVIEVFCTLHLRIIDINKDLIYSLYILIKIYCNYTCLCQGLTNIYSLEWKKKIQNLSNETTPLILECEWYCIANYMTVPG